VPRDDLEEPPALLRVRVGERFHVAANGGQRRAQLVRDVGNEIAPDPVGATKVRDVVQDDDRAAAGETSTGAVRAISVTADRATR
jgi:hypothetical protein